MSIQAASQTSELLHAALSYAARGWRVLPLHTMRAGRCSCNRAQCPSPAKHPRIMNGSTGATTDFAKIREWWDKWPESNVGIATGGDLAVIDLDVSRNGVENWEALADSNGGQVDTLTVSTGGGGRHLYLRTDRRVRNSVDQLAQGVDVRGEGGYVVAPPSTHASGRQYHWLDCDPIDDAAAELASTPTWLVAKIAGLRVVAAPAQAAADAFPEGKRNAGLFALARRMRAQGFGYEEIVPSLLEVNARRCFPPLDPAEVKQIARSAASYEAGVPAELVAQRIVAAVEAPAPEDTERPASAPVAENDCDDWRSTMRRKKSGALEATFGNACAILRNADGYAGTLACDEMALRPTWSGKPMSDALLGQLRERLEREWSLALGVDTLTHAVLTVASERSSHPVRKYLDSLTWDGVERLSSLARNALHVTDALSASMVRKWMLAAVRRVFEPGCKVDSVLVLVGEQGARKSTFFKTLASPAWFGDSPVDVTNKDAVLQMRAAWIYELAEIDGLTSRKHAADVKAFATTAIDTIRVPYGRGVEQIARTSIMCGTTNKDGFLTDETGARRYWIVRVPDLREVEYAVVAEQRDQLWAEAVAAHRDGEEHWLAPGEELDLRARAREHMEADPWTEVVRTWLLRWTSPPTTHDVLAHAIGLSTPEIRKEHESRIGRIMHELGYRVSRPRASGLSGRRRVYVLEDGSNGGPTGPTPPVGGLDQIGEEKSSVVQPVQLVQPVSYAGARAHARDAGAESSPSDDQYAAGSIDMTGPVGPVGPPSKFSGEKWSNQPEGGLDQSGGWTSDATGAAEVPPWDR